MAKPAIKLKNCAVCKNEFQQFRSFAKTCSVKCALKLAVSIREKDERKAHKVAKDKLKSRGDHVKAAQIAFNKYIRARDAELPCVSCGNQSVDDYMTGSKWDCGHYRSTGANPELRFIPLNAAKQCVKCNRNLSGNIVNYRIELVNRIGQDALDWLESKHEPKKYTIDELKEIKTGFNQWARELEKALE